MSSVTSGSFRPTTAPGLRKHRFRQGRQPNLFRNRSQSNPDILTALERQSTHSYKFGYAGPYSTPSNLIELNAVKRRASKCNPMPLVELPDPTKVVREWSQEQYKRIKRNRPKLPMIADTSRRSSEISRRGSDGLYDAFPESVERDSDKVKQVRTFRWYATVIKAVSKLGLDMQRLSIRLSEQVPLSDMFYMPMKQPDEEEEGSKLFFDKSWFSRDRAISKVPLWAQTITIRKPEERTKDEIKRLHDLLMGMQSFREKFTEKARVKICQYMRYTKCGRGRVVLRQGHEGENVYFIFAGSVMIQVEMEDKNGKIFSTTENVIKAGSSFGEESLTGDGLRSATIIVKDPAEFFHIDGEIFLSICPGHIESQIRRKMKFAEKFEIFRSLEQEAVKDVIFRSQVIKMPHGRVLEEDWSKANFVYFVLKGTIKLYRNFDVTAILKDMDDSIEDILETQVALKRLVEDGIGQTEQMALVGALQEGDYSDLYILSTDSSLALSPVKMVSQGAEVLRVSLRIFRKVITKKDIGNYLTDKYVQHNIPTEVELARRFIENAHWENYRKRVINVVDRVHGGELLATIPATAKGTSGWARWPGYTVDQKYNQEEDDSVFIEPEHKPKMDTFYFIRQPKPSRVKRLAEIENRHRKKKDRPIGLTPAEENVKIDVTDGPRVVVDNPRTFLRKPPPSKPPIQLLKETT
ncbi:hypothetical protein LOTGIDRAFT_233393 [Lottia gigantea]|uniref:Cyclic nucleotide-binding domain-containing protein n=1 Tax=Lottia gigantea TaxID=225164 RepID=V4A4H1_LOTGI|nr:hypothetical protein LOTGIDRAFT_233393 [Lottia gigantea]ESO91602.1 hypothetical protein LOTGIDRAFT_233393 [Lottia gigantea]